MKLNHLNLTVTDVPEARRHFETYFGLEGLEEGVTRTSTWCLTTTARLSP